MKGNKLGGAESRIGCLLNWTPIYNEGKASWGAESKIGWKHYFQYLEGPAGVKNNLIWIDLSIVSVLHRLVLKSPIQRISQRVKWTSGALDIIFLLRGDDGGYLFRLETLGWKCYHLWRWWRQGDTTPDISSHHRRLYSTLWLVAAEGFHFVLHIWRRHTRRRRGAIFRTRRRRRYNIKTRQGELIMKLSHFVQGCIFVQSMSIQIWRASLFLQCASRP